jgi:hypothetical protein
MEAAHCPPESENSVRLRSQKRDNEMRNMNKKYFFILERALGLRADNKSLTVPDLAKELNAAGFRTAGRGLLYTGGVGTYHLLSLAYKWCESELGYKAAQAVAYAFTQPNGKHAWE